MRVKGREHHKVEHAYRVLRTRIINQNIRPCEHLQVQQIANELSIGLTPTREALIRLAAEDLVDAMSQRGFFAKADHNGDLLTALWITKAVLCLPVLKPFACVRDHAVQLEAAQDTSAAMAEVYGRLALQIGGTMARKIIEMCNAKSHAYRVVRLRDAIARERMTQHVVRLDELIRNGPHDRIANEVALELDHQIDESSGCTAARGDMSATELKEPLHAG